MSPAALLNLSFSSIDLLRLSSICYQTRLVLKLSLNQTNITSRLIDHLFCLYTTTIPTLWYY
jgi:hypothetical protein